jgi:hypothetical protein
VEGSGLIIQNMGVQAVFCFAKFDCITGEIRTSRDKLAISLEQDVASTRGLHEQTEFGTISRLVRIKEFLRYNVHVWAFTCKYDVEN